MVTVWAFTAPTRTASSAPSAIARSWIARPVESNSVISLARAATLGEARRRPRRARSRPRCATTPAATAPVSSPPWLACSHSSQKRRPSASTRAIAVHRRLRLARAVGTEQVQMLARPQRRALRPRSRRRASPCRRCRRQAPRRGRRPPSRAPPRPRRRRRGRDRSRRPGPYSASAMQRPTHSAVQAAADQPDGAGVLARELLRGDGGRGAGAQRGHGAGVEHRQRLAVAGVGDQHDRRSRSAGRGADCRETTSPT